MKKMIQLSLMLLLMIAAVQVNAQSMDDDKIYKEATVPNSTTNTFHLKLMLSDYAQNAQLDPTYKDKIKQKWEARLGIQQVIVDDQNMTIEAVFDNSVSDQEVMDLLHKLNPNVTQVVPE